MAWRRMSEREVRPVEVLSEMQFGRRTVAAAASVLGVSERQAYRLLTRIRGTAGLGWCTRPEAAVRTGVIRQAYGIRG